ncbi:MULTISPECIES: hypothetical protein [Kordiimonas]|uniref:hypothetical protein n=1 Tax=Kordiimonas TaxID=288021 RepID=UPI00257958E4|nr:hypothetical protein [Kordiimonas sp. UBA4487]
MTRSSLYMVFHLNLAFSSIDEGEHPTVVDRCYRPLLDLAEAGIPIGLEATGYTLRAIKKVAPEWIDCARHLISEGKVELIGSGFCQIIAPLVPPELTRRNLEYGLRDYDALLGARPEVALVNEQAYSKGILPLYQAAGYKAVMMDWAEPASHNPNWSRALADRPQILEGAAGVRLPVLWSDAIAFQKFQRYVHGELSVEEYFEFLSDLIVKGAKAIPIYTSDAEIFDYRPGRFHSEASLGGAEFDCISILLESIKANEDVELVLPSEALRHLEPETAPIRLETSQVPVPVKKQRKYNLTRWGVTGRDDTRLNTLCWRKFMDLNAGGSDADWEALLQLWASDFRTHITDKRWQSLLEGLPVESEQASYAEANMEAEVPEAISIRQSGRFTAIEAEGVHLVLNSYRGLAIQSFGFGPADLSLSGKLDKSSVLGTLEHGFFEDIAYGADFYSGHLVHEPRHAHKITDLGRVKHDVFWQEASNAVVIQGFLDTGAGKLTKEIIFCPSEQSLTIRFDLSDLTIERGVSRLGFVTLNPDYFSEPDLFYACHNGGEDLEYFPLSCSAGVQEINHGKAVSRLVSASTALGMSGGCLFLGDDKTYVRLDMDRADCAGLGMIESRTIRGRNFIRGCISIDELDETSRMVPSGLADRMSPLRHHIRITLGKTRNLL